MNLDCLKKLNIKDNKYLVIGCSAGPDSIALLHYINKNTKNKIVCAHINHNVRKESIEEENYLKYYCQKENIIFESTKIKKYKENNFENEARKKRYEFYEKILNKYNTNYLFLAHHGDDLIETILMKISRGSNLEGYAGIKTISKQKNYYIIRPFLNLTKEDLINYNNANNLKYYIDKSNYNTKYTRNRYRKYILPKLKEENKDIHKQYLKYSKTLLEYNNYIEEETKKYTKKVYKNNNIDIDKFKKIHPFIQKNILYQLLKEQYNNKSDIITEKHINNILDIINNNKPNISINLPKRLLCQKEYNKLLFINKTNNKTNNYKILLQKHNIINNHIIDIINKTKSNGNDICKLNSQNIELPLYIRNKKKGDKIQVLGLNGTKKVSDIFIENKIPTSIRNTYPIVVDKNDNIIWIPNLKKSKFNIQNNKFYDIILRYYERKENND